MAVCLETKNLTVGYNRRPLIEEISFGLSQGEIITLIGPNGSGKSTILKSITGHLSTICGTVFIGEENLGEISHKKLATKLSVVLTDRIAPEMMTCRDVVASGRYPYTNSFGKMTEEDSKIVDESLQKVYGEELADRDFNAISDGQKQRILLARAIAQQPEVIVLDEPTSYLDIKHKIELLDILREMSREQGIGVVMSLHEIDLAPKISDRIICVKGNRIYKMGKPDEIFKEEIISELYDIKKGTYNMMFGSVELTKPFGDGKVFVIGGAGYGAPVYRQLQKWGIPFSTGVLFENDIDFQVGTALASKVFATEAFSPMSINAFNGAKNELLTCNVVINAGVPIGEYNSLLNDLLDIANMAGIPVITETEEVFAYGTR